METASRPEDGKIYASHARRLANAAKRAGEFAYLFETASRLCRTLSLKANICTETRAAYASGEPDAIAEIIKKYGKMIKYANEFYKSFRDQWYRENKPHGFDVQDIRLGGLVRRMESCRDRLAQYLQGEIAIIPELEEELLPYRTGVCYYNDWKHNVTANVL